MTMTEIICQVKDGLACMTLNRSKVLHALNHSMCQSMLDALSFWYHDPNIHAIWIEHAPETRGFCAGGDIKMLSDSGQSDGREACQFFYLEYQLNHLIKTYPKPIIAIIDGITMGGGVGISVHATYRIATENTVFAMPETGIGLIPDVGGGWFLPRLSGEIGTWLGLTGQRLKASDVIKTTIATHYIETPNIPTLKQNIQNALTQNQTIEAVLNMMNQPIGEPQILKTDICALINTLFTFDRAEEIIDTMYAKAKHHEWITQQITLLEKKSPQAVKVALKQLRIGRKLTNFTENMKMEYTTMSRIVMNAEFNAEFHEGVRAVIVDKDNRPQWQYKNIADVPDSEIEPLFTPLPEEQSWKPFNIN